MKVFHVLLENLEPDYELKIIILTLVAFYRDNRDKNIIYYQYLTYYHYYYYLRK